MTVLAAEITYEELRNFAHEAGIKFIDIEAMEINDMERSFKNGNGNILNIFALFVDFSNIKQILEEAFTSHKRAFEWW